MIYYDPLDADFYVSGCGFNHPSARGFKMNNIIPYINAIQNNELSHTHTHTHLVEEDDNSDHLSDDDVLNGIANMPSNPIPKPQNHWYDIKAEICMKLA